MGVSSKKKQNNDLKSTQSSQKQGKAQMNTPPTGQYIGAPNMNPNLNTNLNQTVASSSIIGQSNDILYSYQGIQGGNMPISPQIFDQQPSQDQGFAQHRAQLNNMPNINNSVPAKYTNGSK